jgi:5'-deoxynucleotidase YfbR-like HD superfamily hydrolase
MLAESMKMWLPTYTGKRFDLANPQEEQIDIVDIAHALSLKCRYNGMTCRHYSVAEHCVHLVDQISIALGEDLSPVQELNLLKWSLLHDAAEAYTFDVSRPYYHTFPGLGREIKAREDRILMSVLSKFKVKGEKMPPALKHYDDLIIHTEFRQLFPGQTDLLPQCQPGETVHYDMSRGKQWGWEASFAERQFLDRAQRLEISVDESWLTPAPKLSASGHR